MNPEGRMAEHGEVEYATATGNDYAEHEGTYRSFLHLTVVLIVHIVNILLGLAIGGVMGHWLTAFAVFVIATAAAAHGLLSGAKTSSYTALVLSLLAFALSAGG
jgi:Bacterial aa3 type cytochrome c oxidase subunit IV